MSQKQNVLFYLVIPTVIALCFGWLRAALPDDMPKYLTVMAWLAIFFPMWLVFDGATRLLALVVDRSRVPLVVTLLAGAVVGSLAINPVLIMISENIFRVDVAPMPTGLLAMGLRYINNLLPFVAIWLAVNAWFYYQQRAMRYGYHISEQEEGVVSRGGVSDVLAISAEDHYVRLYTEDGSCLVRQRFSDAVKALSDVDGFQTHRSHWVQRKAIQSVHRDGKKVSLRLINGVELPISRSYHVPLAQEGVL